jgi:hypothetical protein
MMMPPAKSATLVSTMNSFRPWINVDICFTKTAWFKPSKQTSVTITFPSAVPMMNAKFKLANLISKIFWGNNYSKNIKIIH